MIDGLGRDVKSLKDLCLDALAACTEAEWFGDIWLPRELADCFYLKLQKRHLINDQALPVVLHAKSLVADLSGCPITDSGLISLKPCTKIRKLCLSSTAGGCNFSEKRLLECFECFHELRWLELVGISAVSLSLLKLVAKQNEMLTVLKLKECENVTDSCLEVLGLHCHLQSVDLSSTQITARGIAALLSGACKLTLEEFIADQCMQLDQDALHTIVTTCLELRILSVVGCPTIIDVEAAFDQVRRRAQLSWFIPC